MVVEIKQTKINKFMKRITTILTFLMLLCMGAQATYVTSLTDGGRYTIQFVSYDGNTKWGLTSSGTTVSASNGAAGSVFVAHSYTNEKGEARWIFVNNSDGYYLAYKTATQTFNISKPINEFLVGELSTSFSNVDNNADCTDKLYITADNRAANNSTQGCYILKEATSVFDNSSAPYYNGTYTSALLFTESNETKSAAATLAIAKFDALYAVKSYISIAAKMSLLFSSSASSLEADINAATTADGATSIAEAFLKSAEGKTFYATNANATTQYLSVGASAVAATDTKLTSNGILELEYASAGKYYLKNAKNNKYACTPTIQAVISTTSDKASAGTFYIGNYDNSVDNKVYFTSTKNDASTAGAIHYSSGYTNKAIGWNYTVPASQWQLMDDIANTSTFTSGGKYVIYTLSDGTSEGSTRYYLTSAGKLTDEVLNAGQFTFTATTSDNFVPAGYAWKVSADGNNRFTNPTEGERDNYIHYGTQNRDTWDAQVFYVNSAGKYAVRATNANAGSGFDCNAFWTVNADSDKDDDDIPEADYASTLNERHYVWYVVSIDEQKYAFDYALAMTNNKLDKLANIDAYATVAATAKTAVASAETILEIESAVNDNLDIDVAFKNKLTTTAYLATTGADITGSTFSSDCAWKLTNYNATLGSFKVYNAAHETYIAQLPNAYSTAITATTNAENAGTWTIAESSGYAVICASGESTDPAIHYQESGSKAVRWSTTANASMWTVENVYSLSYGHYKIADIGSPSTEDATLFASSTDYYISGTEIEYTAPIAGLSPVDALNHQPEDGAITSNVVVSYYYEQDATLPFTTSTISGGELDNPTWYYMTVNDLATYASNGEMVVDNNNTSLYHDRWCFVGDAINGVMIINERTGVAYPVNIATMANNGNVQITSTSTNIKWFVNGSTLDNLKFYQKDGDDTYFLNQLGDISGGDDYSWRVGLYESGSTIVLTEATNATASPRITAALASMDLANDDVYNNAEKIGYPSRTALQTFTNAMITANMTPTPDNYRTFVDAWAAFKSTTDIVYPSTGYYRLQNYNVRTRYLNAESTNINAIENNSNAGTVVYFERSGDSNSYTIKMQGKYVPAPTQSTQMTLTDTETTFAVNYNSDRVSGWFSIKSGSGNYANIHKDGSNKAVGWAATGLSNNAASYWKIEEATYTMANLTTVGDYAYATLCLPFTVTVDTEDVYAYTLETGNVQANEATFSRIDGGVIPAGTPVLLRGNKGTAEVELTIASDASYVSAPLTTTLLTGIFTNKDISSTKGTDYYLGIIDGNIGFYHWDGNTLSANRAYLPAANVPAAASRGFSIKWNDDVTGVNEVIGKRSDVRDGIFYDLSGRRVQNPQHGLYIVNGKKVVIK